MEIIIDLLYLCDILILHLSPCEALPAGVLWLWEAHLIDDDVVDVDFELRQLDCKSLCLVQTQELRDAHCYECGLCGILELVIDFNDLLLHDIHGLEHLLLHIFTTGALCAAAEHTSELPEHASELLLHLDHLQQSLVQDVREVQQPKGVTSRGSVKNDQLKFIGIERLDDLTEGGGFIDTWD